MATRTQAREAVVSLLYAYDSGNEEITSLAPEILDEKKIKNKQQEFALSLFNGVLKKLTNVDEQVSKHLKEWDIQRIGGIERAILRLGVYELCFTSTDAPIVINEAIELAKLYGSDNAPRFINGVLDAIVKERK
ncbi:transcription antitermination factor NusB [uncultured Helicobacter sp.]|uniref:transcription antitermination factor NusB n=1 Tax=uncultured Helicobacter sp. TaxID=175537 RepID=UPI001F961EE2|nr:transcription antitermination factor NusB [uncultured Helicobacter sp.]HIY44229.1 transcription antitermination factor NusB [Candidatus Helicobacter avistercoris]